MQIENCHQRSGGDSLDVEVFAAAVADVAFDGGLNILAVEEKVAALVSWHR